TRGVVPATDEEMKAFAKQFGDPIGARQARQVAGIKLLQALRAYGEQPSAPDRLKLPVLLAMIRDVRPAADPNAESWFRPLALQLLSHLYRQTHLIYKPDDNARDRTVRLYREKHPAADRASQAIVIYPTNQAWR